MKKLYLPALLLLVFCSCTNNQETVDKGEINSVETRSVEVKSVRDYIESDEFISIIPDEYYALRQKGRCLRKKSRLLTIKWRLPHIVFINIAQWMIKVLLPAMLPVVQS